MNMKKLSILLLILSEIFFVSCNKHNGYEIEGNLTGFPDGTILYLQNSSTQEIFDSAAIRNNKFTLKGHLQNFPEQLYLTAKVNNQFIYVYLLIGNENVNIKGDVKDFPWNVQVNGSKTQNDVNYLRDLTKHYDIERDSLTQAFFKLSEEFQQEKGKKIWDRIAILDDSSYSTRVRYIKTHINTYNGIINLGLIKNSLPKDTVQTLYNKLSPEMKASRFAKILDIYLKEKISEIGDKYHDFEAFNKDGNKIKLSDLNRKYILLDFTSAGCGPCIQSAEELRSINKTLSDSVTIVSFSVDSKKDLWLQSLQRDSVSWLSLWDGKGSYSETYIKYGVHGFPTFFLINPNGKIIDKWVGYGKGSLLSKLERFNNN